MSIAFEHTKTEIVLPRRIVFENQTDEIEKLIGNDQLQPMLFVKKWSTIKKGGRVIIDYGKEMQGGIRPVFGEQKDEDGNFILAELRVRFGESIAECLAELGEKNAGNYHSMRDFKIQATTNSACVYGATGFRFVCIDNIGQCDAAIRSVPAVNMLYGGECKGAFECDDPMLNAIFQTASYTLALCIQNGCIWDGVKRDRSVWVGDMHPEVLSAFYLYGNIDEIKNSLELCRLSTSPGQWMNGILTYSIWWMALLHDYIKYTGEMEYAAQSKDCVLQIMKRLDKSFMANGEFDDHCELEKGRNAVKMFLDWPTNRTPDGEYGVRALMITVIRKVRSLYFEDDELARICDSVLARIAMKNNIVSSYKQVTAMRVLAGLESDNYALERLTVGNAEGMSCFMSYYILNAVSQLGGVESAVSMAKEYYGGMLKMGATTFWEDFDVAWMKDTTRLDELPKEGQKDIHSNYGRFCYTQLRHSLCHGWSTGVIPFLFENVLGVRVAENGFKTVYIKPENCGLKHIKGRVPTPYGCIEVEHTANEQGGFDTKYTAPEEICVMLG